MERAKQFDLFPEPPQADRSPESFSDAEELVPAPSEDAAERPPEAERLTSPSRVERAAKKRRRKAIMDDTAARLGLPGQLLSDAESPFVRARRELEEERRKRRKS